MSESSQYTVVVPAAGIGKRMLADRPKQYLPLSGKTVLEHTLDALISHPKIKHIVIALHPDDPYFDTLPCSLAPWLTRVIGGSERADSVLAGLNEMTEEEWVLVHDAARPCLSHADLNNLLLLAETGSNGGILAMPVRDTMKRAVPATPTLIQHTESREHLWHALTPQFFPLVKLRDALSQALLQQVQITDEASAIEWAGGQVNLVAGNIKNIKITHPDDLALAELYLQQGI